MPSTDLDKFWEAVSKHAKETGAAPLNARPGLWTIAADKWRVWINPHPDPHEAAAGYQVAPFHAYVEYNGWPAGDITPRSAVWNASSSIRALTRAIWRETLMHEEEKIKCSTSPQAELSFAASPKS